MFSMWSAGTVLLGIYELILSLVTDYFLTTTFIGIIIHYLLNSEGVKENAKRFELI